jgi:MFS family permease
MLALAWAVWKSAKSPLWLGAVGFAVQFPALLFGPLGGIAADRFERKRLLQWLALASGLMLAALGFFLSRNGLSPWAIIVAGMGFGSAAALSTPAQQAFIMDLSGRGRVLGAMSTSTALYHASRFVGPALAGLAIARFGEAACVFMGAGAALLFSGSLFFVRSSDGESKTREPTPIRVALFEGLRALRAIPEARLAIVTAIVLSGVGMQFATLMPVFADLRFQGGVSALGWLMAATALGSFAAALWLSRTRPRDLLRLALWSALGFSAVVMVFSQMEKLVMAGAALTAAGFLFTAAFSSLLALVQLRSPENLRGRLMGLFMAAFMGAAPFAHLTAGVLAERIGVVWTTLASSTACFATCAFILMRARAFVAEGEKAASEELSAETR